MDESESVEYILCAAIHADDGKVHAHQPRNIQTGLVYCGHRHCSIFAQMGGSVAERRASGLIERQGFLTNKGRFVERIEAAEIAFIAGQIKGSRADWVGVKLTSEDLY